MARGRQGNPTGVRKATVAGEGGHRRRPTALTLLAVTQFLVVLDVAIVNVALPSIGSALALSQEDLSWVVNAYVLTFGGFLLLGGRTADLLGRRRVFMTGLVVFAAASLAGGLAQSGGQLIAARALQGLGAAIISPAALSIVVATFPEGPERSRAMGVWAAVGGSGGAAGVLLGGVLTGSLGWEWVLWVNVPIALAVVALVPVLIDESRAEGGPRRPDLAGAASATAGLSVLVYALLGANDAGWGSSRTIALFAAAGVLLAAFAWIESRAPAPLVPFRIFRVRALLGANVTALILFGAWFPAVFFISLYLQRVLGYEPLTAGLAFLPLSLGIILSTRVASALATRLGVRSVLPAGLVLMAAGLAWLGQLSPGGSFAKEVLGPSLLLAAGFGLAVVTVFVAAMSGVEKREAGLASGLINTSQQVGGALGLAVLATIATAHTDVAPGGRPSETPAALTEGYQAAFLGAAGLALTAALLALALIPRRAPSRPRGSSEETSGAPHGVATHAVDAQGFSRGS